MKGIVRSGAAALLLAAAALSLSALGGTAARADTPCDNEATAAEDCTIQVPTSPTPAQPAQPMPRGVTPPSIAPVQPVQPVRPARIFITTDRREYWLGDWIRVCFGIPAAGRISIIDETADGRRTPLWSWYDDGRGDCMWAYITPPTGRECLLLRYEWGSYPYPPPRPGDPPLGAPRPEGIAIAPITPVPPVLFARTCFNVNGWWGY